MIIIISAREFLEKPKKFYKLRETHLINGSSSSEIKVYGEGEISKKDFIPVKSIFKDELSEAERDEKAKRFIKNSGITREFATAIAMQLQDVDSNIFIIIDKKVYKKFAEKLCKRFNKLVDLEEGQVIVTYDDFDIFTKWYKKHVQKKINKYEDEFEKKKYTSTAKELNKLNGMLDGLEDAYDMPDKSEARKAFIKDAEPSKDAVKAMRKFLKKNEDVLRAYTDGLSIHDISDI